ncbi:hypothetical protein SELMODRAFT_451153 [Selaginella moellendorffii]|uniref:Uncharacterized protein n=1 Tax=Selaginella moellendorffii TaxID=88036 RepID=D8RI61_SELML|nr:hypothetical protein SELMODRAFT_451153 [Selaginella moellendorffii]
MAKRKEESWESRIRTLHTELAAIRERFSLPEEKAAILDQEPAAPIEELARGEEERQEDLPSSSRIPDDVIFLSPGKLYREIVDLDPDSPLSSPRTCPDVIILPAPPVVAKKSSPAPSDRSGSSRAPPDVIILPAPPVVAKKSSPAPSDRSGSSRPPPVAVDHGFRAPPADQSSPAAPEGSLADQIPTAPPVRRQAPPGQSSLDGIEAIPGDQRSPAPPKVIVGDQSAAAPRNRSPRGLLANQSPRTDQTSRDPQSSPAPAEATPVDSPVRRTRSFRAPPPPPAVDQSSRARRRCSDKDVNLLPSSPPPPPLAPPVLRISSADQSSRDQGLEALPRPRRIKQPLMEDLSSLASSAKPVDTPVSSPHPKNKSTLHGFVSVFLPVLKDVPDWVSGPYQEFKDDSIRLCNKCLSLCEWIYFLTK